MKFSLSTLFFFFYQIWFDRSIFFLLLLLSGGAIYRRWIWVIARFVHFSNCLTRKNNKIKWFIHVSPNKNRIPTPSWNLALFSFFSEIINKTKIITCFVILLFAFRQVRRSTGGRSRATRRGVAHPADHPGALFGLAVDWTLSGSRFFNSSSERFFEIWNLNLNFWQMNFFFK